MKKCLENICCMDSFLKHIMYVLYIKLFANIFIELSTQNYIYIYIYIYCNKSNGFKSMM